MTQSTEPAASASVFVHRSFRLLWNASLLCNMGCWMSMVAASWLMTQLDPRPVMVALVQTASTLPFFLLSMPSGVFADLTDRKTILLAAQTGNLIASAVLAGMAFTGTLTPIALTLVTFALGAMLALYTPAAQAAISEVVPREQMQQAVAYNIASFNVARTLGPGIASAFLVAGAVSSLFLINAVAFALVLLALRRLPALPPSISGLPPERPWAALQAGLRYARHAPHVQALIWRSVVLTLSGSALWALLPLLGAENGKSDAMTYGLRMACMGIGAVLGAIWVSRLRDRFSPEAIFTSSSIVFALATVICAVLSGYAWANWIIPLILLGAGAAWILCNSLLFTLAQTNVPAWVRARTGALLLVVFQGGMALGAFAWGSLATEFSVSIALWVAASITLPGLWLRRPMSLVSGHAHEVTLSDVQIDPALGAKTGGDPGQPVAIEIHYRVSDLQQPDFLRLMQRVKKVRLLNGALHWQLCQSGEDANVFIERAMADSWIEYQRQQARQTLAQRQIWTEIEQLLGAEQRPQIRYQQEI